MTQDQEINVIYLAVSKSQDVEVRTCETEAITISVRKVQNKLMKKVGDKVGYYPTLPNMTDEHSRS
jgi:GH25 family lysozyme M1 (1,4-beta-N-acetylmuramidase)